MSATSQSKYRWYVLSLNVIINIAAYAVPWACMPVLFSEIIEELGLSLVQTGWIWGASAIGGIFIMFFAGLLGDRFGAKNMLSIACLLAGVFGALRGLSTNFFSLAATSLLYGLAIEIIPVNATKTISLWFHGNRLGLANGISAAAVAAGFMLGAMLSATILSPLLGGWRNVLFLYGAISVLIGFFWLLTIHEPGRTEASTSVSAPAVARSLSWVLRIRGVWLLSLTLLGVAGCHQSVMGYLPLYLRGSGWTPASADGALAALNAAGMIFATPILFLSDRFGTRKAFLFAGLATAAIGTGLLTVVTGPLVWFLVVMLGAFRDASWALVSTMMIETEGVGPGYAGTACGLMFVFSRFGTAFGPPLGNSLASPSQPGAPFILWASFAVVAMISLYFAAETGTRKKHNYAKEY